MGNIGIIGRARVGKDTVGKWLVDNRGYRRVAFADALKSAALKVDPIVGHREDEVWDLVYGEWELIQTDADLVHLSTVVADHGWEAAKDEFPEVRRFLQELGAAVRDIDEDFWLRAAMKKVQEANEAGVPVVITDVRYRNEADSLRRAGFHLVYIERPGVPQMDHASENSLTADDADYTICNDSDVPYLLWALENVVDRIYAIESARHANRL
ncbi:hypothetical protein J7I94_19125 [Streptomyces sp. ISL-12]|uniref:deoxynucleotide monophosphate kinase family protein n=1 Tax=Streptomyces sp. ISL-12 TaxID=2819177 RepID=UPI001BE9BEAD|nr:hypothetical protein [Streptomyces sp. ISL-12]MBT2412647.1 hypothetical protein [Streptomyces sp. ISL-12]